MSIIPQTSYPSSLGITQEKKQNTKFLEELLVLALRSTGNSYFKQKNVFGLPAHSAYYSLVNITKTVALIAVSQSNPPKVNVQTLCPRCIFQLVLQSYALVIIHYF